MKQKQKAQDDKNSEEEIEMAINWLTGHPMKSNLKWKAQDDKDSEEDIEMVEFLHVYSVIFYFMTLMLFTGA